MELQKIKHSIAQKWNGWAMSYDEQYAHGLKSEEEKRAWKAVLEEAVGFGQVLKVLDVGTGTGFVALLLAEMGHQCWGVDISEEMLNIAKAKAKSLNLSVKFLWGDAESLPFADGEFDVVVNRHLLWTLPQPERALQEWLRVLRPEGRMVIINGVWTTPGFFNRCKSWLGYALVALQERKNPWADDYEPELKEQLPLYRHISPQVIAAAMERAGVRKVRHVNMQKVEEAEKRVMPLRYRLAYSHVRCLLVGEK